jgi:hypothetical protein
MPLNITSLLLQTVVTYPVARWLLLRPFPPSPPRPAPALLSERATRILQVSAFLLLCALLEVYVNNPSVFTPNLFQSLGVSRSASKADIKKAFRALSLTEHPDKKPGNDAQFATLKGAYETLLNDDLRYAYDAFGPQGIKWVVQSKQEDKVVISIDNVLVQGAMMTAVEMLASFVLAVFLTMAGGTSHARTYALCGLALVFCVVTTLRFSEQDPFGGALDAWFTRFETCSLLWALFPSMVVGVTIIQTVTHADVDAFLAQAAMEVVRNQQEILKRLGASSDQAQQQPALPHDQQAPQQQAAAAAAAAGAPPGMLSRIPSWVYFIALSVVWSYLFEKK